MLYHPQHRCANQCSPVHYRQVTSTLDTHNGRHWGWAALPGCCGHGLSPGGRYAATRRPPLKAAAPKCEFLTAMETKRLETGKKYRLTVMREKDIYILRNCTFLVQIISIVWKHDWDQWAQEMQILRIMVLWRILASAPETIIHSLIHSFFLGRPTRT